MTRPLTPSIHAACVGVVDAAVGTVAAQRRAVARLISALQEHPDPEALDLDVEHGEPVAATPEAAVGPVSGAHGPAAVLANGGVHEREGSRAVGGGEAGEEWSEEDKRIADAYASDWPLTDDEGQWPDGLLGVALRVGVEVVVTPPVDGSCPETRRPFADVATQHDGVRRVWLRAPVARLAEIWVADLDDGGGE